MQIHVGVVNNDKELWKGVSFLRRNKEKYNIIFCVKDIRNCMYFLDSRYQDIDILLCKFTKICHEELFLLKIIKEKFFRIKILLVFDLLDYYFFTKALDVGVEGFLLSDISLFTFEYAMKSIYGGSYFIDSGMQRFFSHYHNKTYFVDDTKLTTREKEIITCVATGMVNKEIAYYLHIREETVKNHLSNIYRKFNVHDRTQAVIYAVKYHYIDL
ncbi:MAG: response regulator transcription factor [Lachnospiraceae bacterium]|nr:response regulator transcription factor [Lachnospiraceae bacterium]